MKRFLILSLVLCLALQPAGAFGFKWKAIPTDASRTGITAAGTENVDEAMGSFKGRTFVAPNGRKFKKNTATAKAARLMIDAQTVVAPLKEVVGYCPEGLSRRGPSSLLGDWTADCLKAAAEKATGRHVDIAITNNGGIRADLPKGDVMVDDLMSMFPFKNYICYVTMKGEDVLNLFNSMAGHMQCVSGVKVTVKDRQVQELLIGGEPLDKEKVYSIGTIDFVLNGGDGIFAGRNSLELIQTDLKLYDGILAYVRELTASGKYIEQQADGRVVDLDHRPQRPF